jgi:hypothetical protein
MKHSSNLLWILAVITLSSSCASPVISPPAKNSTSDSLQTTQQEQSSLIPQQAPLQIGPDIRVDRRKSEVIIRAQIASRNGFLEQLVCKAGTREHESLLAVEAAPKMIHAALLAAGFTPGSPGAWTETQPDASGKSVVNFQQPTGSKVELLVRWDDDGRMNECALCEWVRGVSRNNSSTSPIVFPCNRFVFAGSHIRPNPKSLGPGEHYVADYTGSVVGLVTFGDEVIAFEEVIPDRVDVAPAMWESWSDRIPVEGTPIELIFRHPK